MKQYDFSLLYLNISALSSHINKLVTFLNLLETKFDIICLTESRLSQKNPLTSNINIPRYNTEHTPTQASASGALMFISQTLQCKVQKDLQIYCPKEPESVFIELLFPNKPSFVIGTIYKHPTMQNYKFNIDSMENLLNKIKHESKRTILASDFNLNLTKYAQKTGENQFSEIFPPNNFMPQITLPTRVAQKSATIIDNILINHFEYKCISGNITSFISDHLPQFIIFENFKENNITKNDNQTVFRDFKNLNMDAFERDLSATYWSLGTENIDTDLSFKTFLQLCHRVLDKHALLKKTTKREKKEKIKPWVTKGIIKSVKVKDQLYMEFITPRM